MLRNVTFIWVNLTFFKIIYPRPSTNQSTSLKSGSLFLVMMSVRTYIRPYVCTYVTYYVRTKQNKPIKDLNHFSS